ncbi:MAG: T9SS type A sorting domain-containing protein [Candidatus Kapabacteria bacterium]|nr:T9SS type A sorting domain-containing protein [Candidatus Kapabacteria bacterium]
MIKCLIITISITVNTFFLFAHSDFYTDYVLTRASSNFNGVDFNDKVIVVYGDVGVLLLSTDRGNNWEQINLNDSLNIIDMTNIGNDFYGISDKKYLIRSKDNGRSWSLIELGKELKFHKIFHYNNRIYVISNEKILSYSRDLIKIKEYNYSIDINYYDAQLVRNKIVYVSSYGKLRYLNLDNEQTGVIDLTTYDLCSTCPIPYNLTSNQKDIIFFTLGYDLFQFDLLINSGEYLCQLSKVRDVPFATDGNDIYQIYTKIDSVLQIDSLFFGKVDKVTNEFKHIKLPGNDRYIDNLIINDLKFISKDTIIAVGNDKLIYMSYNGGKHWELNSLLSGLTSSFFYLFLKNDLNLKIIGAKGKFLSTKNGGITWLPQKNYHPVFVENSSFSTGNLKIPYYIDPDNGFIYGESLWSQIDTNILFTKDGGETLEMKKIKNLQHFNNETAPILIVYQETPIIVTQRSFPNSPLYTVYDVFNKNVEIINRKYIQDTMIYCIFNIKDKFYAVGRDYKQNEPYTYKLYYSVDTVFNWISDFSFKADSSSWNSTFFSASNIDDFVLISFIYSKRINNNFFQFCKIYSIDISRKTINEVYKADSTFFLKALKLNNIYYVILQKDVSFQMLYSESITKPIRDWNIMHFKRISPPLILSTESRLYQLNGFLSDTLFYFIAYDSLFNKSYLFKASTNKILDVEESYQTEIIPNIIIQSIHPIPSNDLIKISIIWNQKYDIDEADFKVFNMLGEVMTKKEDFIFSKINSYSGELTLNTNNLSSGAYLISVTLEGSNYTRVLIVLK